MRKVSIEKSILEKAQHDGMSLKDAAKLCGCCVDTVRQEAKRFGIVINNRGGKGVSKCYRQYKYIDEDWLRTNWVNTSASLNQLAIQESVSLALLENRVAYYKLHKPNKYTLNLEKLQDIEDPNLYYLAGLIATDGYMWKDCDNIDIELVGDDERVLLETIRNYYKSNKPLVSYGHNSYRLSFFQRGVKDVFKTYFNIPDRDKTKTVGVPHSFFNEDCVKAYVLGCIDGDGSLGYKKPELVIVTQSYDFISGLCNIINESVGIRSRVTYFKSSDTQRLYPKVEYGGNTAYKVLKWVYSTSCDFRLKRKYDRFLDYTMKI